MSDLPDLVRRETSVEAILRRECKRHKLLQFKVMKCSVAGMTDRVLVRFNMPADVAFLEVKTTRGRLSPKQRAAHAALRAKKAKVATAYGADGVRAAVAEFAGIGFFRDREYR